MQYLKDTVFWNNTLFQYLISIGILIISIVSMRLALIFLLKILLKLNTRFQSPFVVDLTKSIKSRTKPIIFISSLAIARIGLNLPKEASGYFGKVVVVFIIVFSTLFICDVITNFTNNYLSKKKDVVISDGIVTILKVLVWVIGFLTILSNLGVNVNTFITGLGVGGVAVAFAAQSIIADLFNYFVIVFDKPFLKGDFIQVDADKGVVEYIGIKSTRIRRNTGEQLLISNTNLLSSRIQNYRILEKRRQYMVLGVEYSTPLEKLKVIPSIIQSVIESTNNTEFYSARFIEFADSSLNFEVIYHVTIPDYAEFVKIVEDINYKIIDEFNKLGVGFAFPSRTLYISKE
ncbi:mechanosensitive ion channel family protein [Brachyspira hyodysenteriae]|uniref:Mechanosensitive ion channel n=1 Tax=Brachyspira hyodysenteriae (strain ATCC 49526 / WA1) TaxID=565034 RepID=A0A3B6VAQ4_BRAHW|nr:mechanosensitive ion channel family protein [Brachyspira hyodysenteriae]ACN83327.1 mechanosensitive ion channel [Brachyspira hyodysenteriae WA1]KLI31909.1 mechanosensitive ion channel protein [Brachyspira hyodysenteriae]KLI38184.1 mechanosensitive ion channel protein [Brachyspira hyodysenteriae]KLI41441.1 mechanosensitive ion channel protein [Brachyspira hyodysenteriae]KLI50624.1 mechanosensitive ion channel protein [Brachyspira hyodysenteriae]